MRNGKLRLLILIRILKGPHKVKIEERPRSHPEGMTDPFGGVREARSARREGSPAPTQQYSPGDTGIRTPPDIRDLLGDSGRWPGDGLMGDGDGGDDEGNGDPPNPPNDHEGDKARKDKHKLGSSSHLVSVL